METKIVTKQIQYLLIGKATLEDFYEDFDNSDGSRLVHTPRDFTFNSYRPNITPSKISFGCQSATIDEIRAAVEFLKTGTVKTERLLTKGGVPKGAKVLSPVVDETEKYYITKKGQAYLKSDYGYADVPRKAPKGINIKGKNVYISSYSGSIGTKDQLIENLETIIKAYDFLYGKS